MASNKKMHMPIEMTVNNRGLRSGLNKAQAQFGRFADQTSQKMQKSFGIGDALGIAALLKAKEGFKAANTLALYARHHRGMKGELKERSRLMRTYAPSIKGFNETSTRFIGPARLPHLEDVRKRRLAQKESLREHSQRRRGARMALGLPGGNLKSVLGSVVFSTAGIAAIGSAATAILAVSGFKLMRDAQASAQRGDAYNSAIIKAVVEKDIKQFKIDRKLSKATTASRKFALDAEFRAKNMGGVGAANAGNIFDGSMSFLGGAMKGNAGFLGSGAFIGWALGWNNGPFGAFGSGGQS